VGKKSKYYVVWEGNLPGVFDDWAACKASVWGVNGAKYKSFDSRKEAEEAFAEEPREYLLPKEKKIVSPALVKAVGIPVWESISVDAACSGNPGKMEYRGVYTATKKELFHIGPLEGGTNNIGEFLAIVHGLAFLKQQNSPLPLYSDSYNAILWVRKQQAKTSLSPATGNEVIFDLIARAEKWLKENSYTTPILKWETEAWGEIPADFGRK
jgi:ribonuclease HI